MESKPIVIGMCAGLAAGLGAAVMMKPKKRQKSAAAKNAVGKTLRAMGDMADTVSSAMGL